MDNDYEIRKQAQIDASNKKALERLEEIDMLMTQSVNKSLSYDQLKAFHEIKNYELDAYQTWCENKLAVLQEKKATMIDQYGNELAALAQMAREYVKEFKRSQVAFQLAIQRGEQIAMFVMLANWIIDNEGLTVEAIKARVKTALDGVMGVK
jgi:hypothetical protein